MTGREEYDRTGGIDRKLGIYCKRKGVLCQERGDMAERCGFGSKIGIEQKGCCLLPRQDQQ
jgi:hypothetical protein